MVIGLLGENCTGKSSIAQIFSERDKAQIFTGKDYLRMAKNKDEAAKKISEYLIQMQDSSEFVIYIKS